jgi:hypothetical protein
MSRGEELRAKFKAKGQAIAAEMNSPAGKFRSALYGFVLDECHARSDNDFADQMFAAYETEKPTDLQAWFLVRVKPLFKSVSQPPTWVLEPDWCYHAGVPMEFLHQFTDDEDVAFYIFRGKLHVALDGGVSGHRMFYKMCAQDREGTIRFATNMIGE